MNIAEYEQIQPHINVHGLVWLTPNQHCAWRVESLMTKEPDTVAWINTMGPGDVLYDVGANIGQYSMLAAKRGVRVHAFEPESQNFALLCRNIALNKLGDLITPWPIALTDGEGDALGIFHVTQLIAGGSCNTFGESVDFNLKPKKFASSQGMFGCELDVFAQLPERVYPTHIKIDVDGFEHKVIQGALLTLSRETMHSILIETNTHLPEHVALRSTMKDLGYVLDEPTAEIARRKEGTFAGIGNCIYYKGSVPK